MTGMDTVTQPHTAVAKEADASTIYCGRSFLLGYRQPLSQPSELLSDKAQAALVRLNALATNHLRGKPGPGHRTHGDIVNFRL